MTRLVFGLGAFAATATGTLVWYSHRPRTWIDRCGRWAAPLMVAGSATAATGLTWAVIG
jgi:hypothetical protein